LRHVGQVDAAQRESFDGERGRVVEGAVLDDGRSA
jgi:hypothetical protein